MSVDELLDTTARAIVAECGALADLLVEKNRKYGDSALQPLRLFSRADAVEQLRARIDDKLSRIRSAQADDTEDAELDLLGYLVLLRIARKRAGATDKDYLTVAAAENSCLDKLRALRHDREGSSGYVVPPVDDGDDDPAVVHVVPEKTSRAPLIQDVVCTACGNRFFSVSENGRHILETGACFACKDLVADGPPVQIPPETVLPLKQMPDECLGALCGRVRR
jgi:hypothetical protein